MNDVDLFFSPYRQENTRIDLYLSFFLVNSAFQSNIVREATLRRSIPANRDTPPRHWYGNQGLIQGTIRKLSYLNLFIINHLNS